MTITQKHADQLLELIENYSRKLPIQDAFWEASCDLCNEIAPDLVDAERFDFIDEVIYSTISHDLTIQLN